jgi:hypothetical protein
MTLVRTRISVSLAALALTLLVQAVGAAPVCRWVDERGRTQISDVVPDKYKKAATCTDSQKYELSPAQRREADQRAAEERARPRSEAANPPKESASGPLSPAAPASQPGAKRPAEVVTDATDCQTWWRVYDESADCFGPYRTARGGIKPEAFDNCNVVPNPELKCGPRRN